MFCELLATEFSPYGELTSKQLGQLEAHYQRLMKWNERINLTRIRDLEDVVRLHYCESLFVAKMLPLGRHEIADVGSGAGFPGIPLAIARPECRVTLVESHQRKAVFLREASRSMSNTQVLPCRAQEVREKFDWLVSRAVAPEQVRSLALPASVAILLSEGDAASLGPQWQTIRLPWGKNRFLAMFHVEQGN